MVGHGHGLAAQLVLGGAFVWGFVRERGKLLELLDREKFQK